MQIRRRSFLTFSIATVLRPPTRAPAAQTFRPEDFGARGDGLTNDTRAFAALSTEVNRHGGGTILLGTRKTYVVGEQVRGGKYAWTPVPIVELSDLLSPLRIVGNGARLLCQAGLRFGTFDTRTGATVRRPMPNFRIEEVASPYQAMIAIRGSRAPIEIVDLELDGNIDRLQIGGPYGDTGWQLPASGLMLADNHATETIANVLSHHHAQDGAIVDGNHLRTARSRFIRFAARHNGRQGVSIIAGRGYDFEDCEFSHTGRAALMSAPAAGVDIEAETDKPIRDLTFERCRFIDNSGVGMVADSGDSESARFTDCLFVGTTTWSAWPKKPRFTFERCTFVGAVVNAHFNDDPEKATQFRECRFTDDPALSPTGQVYPGGDEEGSPIVNLGQSQNILFDRCTFDVKGISALPWSWRATYRDCTMSQRSRKPGMTKGKYLGRTVIDGPVDLYGSMILGTVIVNGRQMPPGPVGVAAW